jgi:hypothetical protein
MGTFSFASHSSLTRAEAATSARVSLLVHEVSVNVDDAHPAVAIRAASPGVDEDAFLD